MKLWIARNKSKTIKLFTIESEYNSIADEWKGYDFEEIELSVLNFTNDTIYILYNSYEQAAIAGIEYVLDDLI